jgi:hypothetical protein
MNIGYLAYPHPSISVLHVQDVLLLPVQVVREVGYLLVDAIEGVA